MFQTHTSVDLVAACAGFPYGLVDVVRILQEVRRPVLLVCAEKFSDKVGSVRTSRMIFGDGAAALVVAPAPEDAPRTRRRAASGSGQGGGAPERAREAHNPDGASSPDTTRRRGQPRRS